MHITNFIGTSSNEPPFTFTSFAAFSACWAGERPIVPGVTVQSSL